MIQLSADSVPLEVNSDGAIRVRGSRVSLDSIVCDYLAGSSAEEIADHYPVALADVYSVLGYYLSHRAELDAVLQESRDQANQMRAEIERTQPNVGLRERLMARSSAAK
jgi:uncharacterized protein (DUF433 family)